MSFNISKLKIIVIFVIFYQLSFAQNITITHPTEGSRVDQTGETISFTSNAPINDPFRPVVFIQDPTQQWWLYLAARNLDEQKRTWTLGSVQFGEEGDGGQTFRIQVIVISQTQINNGIRNGSRTISIEQNEPIRNKDMIFLRNKKLLSSNIVKVVRR